ncbi:MAG: hypothetical protein Q8R13_05400 [bacterium]|nr:hypothetical protein [bacterium]
MPKRTLRKLKRVTLEDLAAMTARGFGEVQAGLAVVKEEVAGVKADLVGVKAGLAVVKEEVAGVKADLVGVKADLVGVKAGLAVVKEEVAGVKADLVGVKAGLAVVKEEVAGVKADLTRIERKVDDGFAHVNARLDQVRRDIADLDDLRERVETLEGQMVVFRRK